MLDSLISAASGLLLGLGAFFYVVSAIGLVRLPDVFSRMHAGGLSETMGTGLMIAGMMLAAGFSLVSAKLAIILAVVLFTSPITTHALAQAAMHAGVKPVLKSPTVLGRRSRQDLLKPKRARRASQAKKTRRKAAAKPARRRAGTPTPKGARS